MSKIRYNGTVAIINSIIKNIPIVSEYFNHTILLPTSISRGKSTSRGKAE